MTEPTSSPGERLDDAIADAQAHQADQDQRLVELEARMAAVESGEPVPIPPDPPDPTPDGSLIYGYGHTNRSRLENDTGVLVCADRHFAGGKPIPPKWSGWDPAALPMRYYPICSFKPGNWDQAGTGQDASNFRSFLASVPRPIVLIPNHEPENDGKQPSAYRGMIKRYDAIAADVANPHVTMAYNLMRTWISKPAGQRSEDYIVSQDDLACDWILSWDGYQRSAADSPAELFGQALALNQKYGYPFAIAETATSVGSNAAAYVRQVTDWAVSVGALWLCYWPSQTSDPNDPNHYPPSSAFPAFADVALDYGGTPQ